MIGPTNARGGGGLNLKVVGGTTKPTNPRENTIWVNTSVAITGYVLSPTKPGTGTEGQVWLQTANSGVEINVGKRNAVLLHITACNLYTGGSWQMVSASVYVSGAWTEIDTSIYLVKDGVLIAEMQHTSAAQLTQKSGYVELKGASAGYHAAWLDNVDLTDKTTISVAGEFNTVSQGTSINAFSVAIWDKTQTNIAYTSAKAYASYNGKNSAQLDVSAYTGIYKVGITSVFTNVQKITKFEIT